MARASRSRCSSPAAPASIAKEFRWGQNQALELRFDVMNVFNRDVDNAYEGNYYSPNFGKATGADPNLTRRFQIGARYSF